MKLNLDNWQKDFLAVQGNKILCTGRQVGKSLICSIDAGEYAIHNGNKLVMIIAPTERQAYELFDKVLDYLIVNYKSYLKAGKDRPTKSKIELKNQTKILCLPVGVAGQGIRGYTIHRLYIDECARVPDEVVPAVFPMLLTTGGSIILLSTPFGMKGFFYEIWADRKDAYKDFTRFSIFSKKVMEERPISFSWTNEQRTKALAFLEAEEQRMTKKSFMQEYMGEFVEDLMQFFPDDLIRKVQKLLRPASISSGKYYLGVDVGGKGGSESTFEIIKKAGSSKEPRYIQVENLHPLYDMITMTTRQILHLDAQYHFRKILIDSGGLGCGVSDFCLENQQVKRRIEEINNSKRNIVPENEDKLIKTSLMKNDLYDNLLCLMERDEIELLDDPEVFQSLKSVQFEITEKKELILTSNYGHVVEGIIRACWGAAKDKSLKLWAA